MSLGYRPDGSRRRQYVRGRTRREAERKAQDVRRSYEDGGVPAGGKLTVGAYLAEWLDLVQRHEVSPETWANNEAVVRLHVVPKLGHLRLEQLRAAHVRALLNDMRASHAPATVLRVYSLLRKALAQAAKERLVAESPVAHVAAPSVPRPAIVPLTASEARLLVTTTAGTVDGALVLTAVAIGARQGELAALRWEDVDLAAGLVRISRSVTRRSRAWRIKEPKTRAGIRHVSLPASVNAALAAHRLAQLEHRLATPAWVDLDLVFPRVDGTPQYSRTMLANIQEHMARAGIEPRRFHDLRHTAVTLMLEQGVALTTISDVVGHSSYRVTKDVYGHLTPALRADAADRMQAFFAGGSVMDHEGSA